MISTQNVCFYGQLRDHSGKFSSNLMKKKTKQILVVVRIFLLRHFLFYYIYISEKNRTSYFMCIFFYGKNSHKISSLFLGKVNIFHKFVVY